MSSMRLIDKVRVEVRAGKGGDGVVAYTAHKLKRLLGPGLPSGGNGGRGGDVTVVSSNVVRSLGSVPHVVQGGDGKNGRRERENGSPGESVLIKVPVGVAVYSQEDGRLIADLDSPDQSVLVATGGAGGKGNNRVRPHEYSKGEKGTSEKILLELKTVADIGLVGFPNAGKSSLLNMISRASPKIAPYPFTTLAPFVGTVALGDRKVAVADLPGLVEEAHLNRGMGHEFLRHIERTRALLFVLDVTGRHWNPKQDSGTSSSLASVLKVLRTEVEMYDESLGNKPWGVVVNKLDPEADSEMRGISSIDSLDKELTLNEDSLSSYKGLVGVSAKFGIGRKSVIDLIFRLVSR